MSNRFNAGVRITIDGHSNTGKTILVQAFAAFLEQCGVPAEQLTQLCDTHETCRLKGQEAIDYLKKAVADGLWKDNQLVFLERITPRVWAATPESEMRWNAMPDLSKHDLPHNPSFGLPHSQVEFEMTNRVPPSPATETPMDLHRVVRHMPRTKETPLLEMVSIHPEEYTMLVRLNELVKIRLNRDVLLTRPTVDQAITAQYALMEDRTVGKTSDDAQRDYFNVWAADDKLPAFDHENPVTPDLLKMSGLLNEDGTLNVYEVARRTGASRTRRKQLMFGQMQEASEVGRIRRGMLTMLNFADMMAAFKNGDWASWFKGQMKLAGHQELLAKFDLQLFRDITDDPASMKYYNDLRKDFINRGTDIPFVPVTHVAEFRPMEGAGDPVEPFCLFGGANAQLREAIHAINPGILVRITYNPRNSNISGGHLPEIKDVQLKYSSKLLQPQRFWQVGSLGAALLNEADPVAELKASLSRRGYSDFFVYHDIGGFDVIDRQRAGFYYDQVREEQEPNNPLQAMMEVCVHRKDREPVTKESFESIRQMFFQFDPLIIVSVKLQNSGFSGSFGGHSTLLFDPPTVTRITEARRAAQKQLRGHLSSIYQIDDAALQPRLETTEDITKNHFAVRATDARPFTPEGGWPAEFDGTALASGDFDKSKNYPDQSQDLEERQARPAPPSEAMKDAVDKLRFGVSAVNAEGKIFCVFKRDKSSVRPAPTSNLTKIHDAGPNGSRFLPDQSEE